MIFSTPQIKGDLKRRLDELDELRHRLSDEAGKPRRWMGVLHRLARATAAASSTSIEGFEVEPRAALALASGESPAGDDEDRMAVAAYSRATDHIAVLAVDPGFRWLDRVILDLHFDACHFQGDKRPGAWREGPIGVSAPDGGIAYAAPDAERVPELMGEVVAWLEDGDSDQPAVVRAAMAHLHLVSVHPFADGNGRVARIVQSLVLARVGNIAPELTSIEEYLAEHTVAYYEALRQAQGGSYQPERDATSWIEFGVEAHVQQARRRLDQISQAAIRWELLEAMVAERGWPERLVIALERSLVGGVDRRGYAAEADVSFPTASGDLRRLADTRLVVPEGAGRSARYLASDELRERIDRRIREGRARG